MLKLGETQVLKVVKIVEFGVYLSDPSDGEHADSVLLPIKQAPDQVKIGDEISVFLYKDSKDRLIATTNEPKLHMGEIELLTVAAVGKLGAFLDWGLEKDLFLPYKEQTTRLKANDHCLVRLYIDKSERLCASMKLYSFLRTDSHYQKDDRVSGIVYEISDQFGAFVAVDHCFSALIPQKELTRKLKVGEEINARVTGIKEDGKIDLSLREKAYIQMSIDADRVMKKLEKENGIIPFTDKASPEIIRDAVDMSKNEFKRAVGNLLKAGKIIITDQDIRLK